MLAFTPQGISSPTMRATRAGAIRHALGLMLALVGLDDDGAGGGGAQTRDGDALDDPDACLLGRIAEGHDGPHRVGRAVVPRHQGADHMGGDGRQKAARLGLVHHFLMPPAECLDGADAFLVLRHVSGALRHLHLTGGAKGAVVADDLLDVLPQLGGDDGQRDLPQVPPEAADAAGIHAG